MISAVLYCAVFIAVIFISLHEEKGTNGRKEKKSCLLTKFNITASSMVHCTKFYFSNVSDYPETKIQQFHITPVWSCLTLSPDAHKKNNCSELQPKNIFCCSCIVVHKHLYSSVITYGCTWKLCGSKYLHQQMSYTEQLAGRAESIHCASNASLAWLMACCTVSPAESTGQGTASFKQEGLTHTQSNTIPPKYSTDIFRVKKNFRGIWCSALLLILGA